LKWGYFGITKLKKISEIVLLEGIAVMRKKKEKATLKQSKLTTTAAS